MSKACKTCGEPCPSARHTYCSEPCKPGRSTTGKSAASNSHASAPSAQTAKACKTCGQPCPSARHTYCSESCKPGGSIVLVEGKLSDTASSRAPKMPSKEPKVEIITLASGTTVCQMRFALWICCSVAAALCLPVLGHSLTLHVYA